MLKRLTPSRLRVDLYRVLDRIIATGESVEIERHGHRLLISHDDSRKVDTLRPHPEYLKGDPESLVHMDWSEEWRP